MTDATLVERFVHEAGAAGAVVHGPVASGAIAGIVGELADKAANPDVLAWQPAALWSPEAWRQLEARGLTPLCPVLPGDPDGRGAVLDRIDHIQVGLTTVIGALADTGTCVLASRADRPRLAWLLPGCHVAVVRPDQIVPDMAAFFAASAGTMPDDPAHLAFVTGPSRTADIELTLTRGVHGPRELHIVLTDR